jgi:outer membrane protein OmpA-like peptidoglycan-associated protein
METMPSAQRAPRRARRILGLLALAGWSWLAYGQSSKPGWVAQDQKEGTLVVNYYASAPDPELEQLRALTVDALGVYLRGQILLTDTDLGWAESVRSVSRDMDRIVSDMLRIRSFAGTDKFQGFSPQVSDLLLDFEELDPRDAERFRTGQPRSFEENLYVLVEQRLQEILLQAGVELGRFVNRGLLQKIGTIEQSVSEDSFEEWMELGVNQELKPLELNFSLESMSLLDGDEDGDWDDLVTPDSPATGGLEEMMLRVLDLLENQNERLAKLENRSSGARDWAERAWTPSRTTPASDSELRTLNLPESFSVQFYEGSTRLTLAAQLQLNEVVEVMGMHERLRVVCTGHADVKGDRAANLALSKRRSEAARAHLLESGVASTRVVLNYFGEERAQNRGALDRRVEVAFFVEE